MDSKERQARLALTDGHRKAIVQMYANGESIRNLATWYRVSQDEIREILRPHVRLSTGKSG